MNLKIIIFIIHSRKDCFFDSSNLLPDFVFPTERPAKSGLFRMNLNGSSVLKTFLAPNKKRNQCRNLREIIIVFVSVKTFAVCRKKEPKQVGKK